MIASVVFFLTATFTLICALHVITSKDLVHCVFWLAGTLIGTAGLFVLLSSPFLAGIQIVLYTGGVITLMLFGVMLTHRDLDETVPNPMAGNPVVAGLVSLVVFGHLTAVAWSIRTPPRPPPYSTKEIGQLFLGQHVIAFEALSVLLLAAMIGAIVLARRSDP